MSLLFLKWEHLSQSGEHDASSQRCKGTLGRKWVTLLDVDKRKSTHVLKKYSLSRYYVTNHKLDATDQILSINKYNTHQFSSVQSLSHVRIFVTPWTRARQAPLSITNSWSMFRLMSMNQWCHPTISFSVVPFSSHLQSCPASGSFPVSQFFPSGSQSVQVSASAWVLPMNILNWFPLQLTSFISLQSKGLSRLFSNTRVQKQPFFSTQLSLYSNSHIHIWLLEKL